MAAKIPKYTREWLAEALKLSLSSIRRGEDEKSVARRLHEKLAEYLEKSGK